MVKFDLILEHNPCIREIVEVLLANKSPSVQELIKMVVEGTDQHAAKEVLKHFVTYEKHIMGEES